MPENVRRTLLLTQTQLARVESLRSGLQHPLFTTEQRRKNPSALLTAGELAQPVYDKRTVLVSMCRSAGIHIAQQGNDLNLGVR